MSRGCGHGDLSSGCACSLGQGLIFLGFRGQEVGLRHAACGSGFKGSGFTYTPVSGLKGVLGVGCNG